MDKLLTTSQLIEMLKVQDPEGDRVLSFRIKDERDDEIIAFGDIYSDCISLARKNAYQTQEGDADVLRISIKLDRAD